MQNPLISQRLAGLNGLHVYANSPVASGDAVLFLARQTPGAARVLGILAPPASGLAARFRGTAGEHDGQSLLLCPLDHENALALRAALPWLRPQPLGLETSAGCGDRLGLATPGHVRAAEALRRQAGRAPAMIFAQQSIREMARTQREPDEVMDDATWGIFQEGWHSPVGADADHLKTPADIDRCAAAGFTFYTIDPGDHVVPAADTLGRTELLAQYAALPWADLQTTPDELRRAYAGRPYDLEDRRITLDEEALLRAAVKYGRSVTHTATMYRHLVACMGARPWELEVSVDETETPTTLGEHLFIASELRRLGVNWVSLAPRYVGRFEKGVDYIGDLGEFEASFAGHAAIARAFGPYKLSLHSGSDKFSIYAIAARHAHGLLHLKTAGTSYVEALRAVGMYDAPFFRELLDFAIARYETDRASYHVSAELAKVPRPATVADADLPGLLDQFDTRQALHVTFGSVLTSDRGYRARLLNGLAEHEEAYNVILERHFLRHLQPMLAGS